VSVDVSFRARLFRYRLWRCSTSGSRWRFATPGRVEDSPSPVGDDDWAGAVVPAPASGTDDPANAGIRREPELPEHEDIAPESAKAVREFEPGEEESDDDAQRLRAFQRSARTVARQVSLDPADDMGL
jgi:type IV secretion system protein VirD4